MSGLVWWSSSVSSLFVVKRRHVNDNGKVNSQWGDKRLWQVIRCKVDNYRFTCDPDLISLNFNLKSFAMYNNGEPLAFGPPNRPMFNCQFTSEKTNKSGQSFGNVQHRC